MLDDMPWLDEAANRHWQRMLQLCGELIAVSMEYQLQMSDSPDEEQCWWRMMRKREQLIACVQEQIPGLDDGAQPS